MTSRRHLRERSGEFLALGAGGSAAVSGARQLLPDEEAFRDRLRELLVDELYLRSGAALAALLLMLPVLQRVIAPAWTVGPEVASSFYLFVTVAVLRLLFVLAVRRFPGLVSSASVRLVAFAVGSTAGAVAMAVLQLVVVPLLDEARMALLAVCAAGISAVGMVSMAGSLVAYLLYVVPVLGSFAVAVVLRGGGDVERLLVVLVAIFLAALVVIASHVHFSLRRALLLQLTLQDLALRDELTGLRNRRSLEERMAGEEELILASWAPETGRRRPQSPDSVGVLVLDLDHFKEVNDLHGHSVGDQALRQLAAELRRQVRPPDLVVRWGGEEFVVVVRDPERCITSVVAERIRRGVAATTFALGEERSLRLTCSVGWALLPFSTVSPGALRWRDVLDLADAALRAAKAAGRDRVVGLVAGAGFDADPRAGKRRVEEAPSLAQGDGLVEVLDGGPSAGVWVS